MSKINSLLIHYLLLLSLSLINSQSIQEVYYGPAAIRSMTMLSDGTMLGGRVAGHEIQVWVNTNKGLTWSLRGSVANNDGIDFGDVMFKAIPNTNVVFCAFREHNRSNGLWSVTVCRSDDNGFNWVYDSTVIGGQSLFVGAPWLFLANNGDLQCYYDSEPLASYNGAYGSQWIAMQGKNGINGEWIKYGVVTASRDSDVSKLCRDGMATVIDLGNNRIMLVTEGVEDYASGGKYANVIRAIQSFDGGKTWDFGGRRIVYQSRIDGNTGRRYNAYCPMGIRIGGGPVGVVFCTDEDFGGTPDESSEDVTKRRTHVKFIRTLDNFETWGDLKLFWGNGNQAYAPGMYEISWNEVMVSIDHFGNQRVLIYK